MFTVRYSSSKKITGRDKELIQNFVDFVLDKFVTKKTLASTTLNVHIVSPRDKTLDEDDKKQLIKDFAWCTFHRCKNGRKIVTVVINSNQINGRYKSFYMKFRDFLLCLGHELIHCKQYLSGELKDYVNCCRTNWRGEVFDTKEPDDRIEALRKYHDYPWEIEAYGREIGLVKEFVILNKIEQKEFKVT